MRFDIHPYGKPFNMLLSIRVLRAVNLRLSVFDAETGRIYLERPLRLNRNKRVLVKMPIVPDQLTCEIIDKNLPRQNSAFKLEHIKVIPDTKCPVELTQNDKSFIRFAKWFATESSRLQAGKVGTLYQSDGFAILYMDNIIDNGIELSTPARIAKESGVIQVSKKRTQDYTVPMLIVMLLHEYAHKFKNHEYGKKESNELAADLIACHITLNLGFDPMEVKQCFKDVFGTKNTQLNKKRMAAITEFIQHFKNNESIRCNINHETRPK